MSYTTGRQLALVDAASRSILIDGDQVVPVTLDRAQPGRWRDGVQSVAVIRDTDTGRVQYVGRDDSWAEDVVNALAVEKMIEETTARG